MMVTHNVFQAHRLGTHAALILDGRIIEQQFGGKILHKTRGYTHLRVHPRRNGVLNILFLEEEMKGKIQLSIVHRHALRNTAGCLRAGG